MGGQQDGESYRTKALMTFTLQRILVLCLLRCDTRCAVEIYLRFVGNDCLGPRDSREVLQSTRRYSSEGIVFHNYSRDNLKYGMVKVKKLRRLR